ncbi:MAG: hypothetical protein ABIW83_09970 [Allosphingosinicella sp.]
MQPACEHDFDFGFGERYQHAVIPYSRIELDVPAGPGLYSWHLRLPRTRPERATAFLQALYHAASIHVQASANMRQKWTGRLASVADPFGGAVTPSLASAFFAIAYPLYVGISLGLRGRLSTHKRQLEVYKDERPSERIETVDADTEGESRCFGERLGAVFRESRFYETELLFVKCVSWPAAGPSAEERAAVMTDLRAAEWTCNTLFHPVFGRR